MLLQVKNVTKSFPIQSGFFRRAKSFFDAVCDVSFDLEAGQVLGVVGESGSGKSTLAKMCLNLLPPTSGHILFEGLDIARIPTGERKKIAKKRQIVFQNPAQSLNPRKTVLETIGEVLFFHEMIKSKDEEEPAVVKLLEQVHLEKSFMNRYPHELSSGQQQRISIARAISSQPRLLVLDECVSALDISVQAQILNLLLELKSVMKMSYLFISHDLSVVEHLADRVLVMCAGKVIEEGEAVKLFSQPEHPYTKLLLSSCLASHPAKRTLA